MEETIKDAWLEALESGEFKKGKMTLKKTVRGEAEYCCLGVLCELAAREIDVSINEATKGNGTIYTSYNGLTYSLPRSVMEWAGMRSSQGIIPQLDTNLARINDDTDTFEQVIDVIREHWRDL